MLNKIKALFNKTVDQQPDENEIQLAAATLMFEVVRADDSVDDIELSHMSDVLSKHFNLAKEDIDALITSAEKSSEDAISLQSFTRKVCDNWDNAQRCQLIENLWLIAFADGNIDTHERHIIRKIAALLYLNDKQIILAREGAKHRMAAQAN